MQDIQVEMKRRQEELLKMVERKEGAESRQLMGLRVEEMERELG